MANFKREAMNLGQTYDVSLKALENKELPLATLCGYKKGSWQNLFADSR
jgi:hypothetical protein